jgi:uncharacterized protein DUF4190
MAAAPPSTATPLDRHASPVADTERRTGRAVASMVLGIISIPTFFFWPVAITLGVLAIVIGTMARTDARKMGYVNTGQAKAGVICGIAGIVLAVGFIVVIAIAAN